MEKYHAVMIDETGCEFGVDLEANSRSKAFKWLEENYPESRCDQLETRAQARKRENDMYRFIGDGGDWDDDGCPFYHY